MKKLYPCMLCEKRFAEIEQAEVCEQSHAAPPKPVNLMDALRRALDARLTDSASGTALGSATPKSSGAPLNGTPHEGG